MHAVDESAVGQGWTKLLLKTPADFARPLPQDRRQHNPWPAPPSSGSELPLQDTRPARTAADSYQSKESTVLCDAEHHEIHLLQPQNFTATPPPLQRAEELQTPTCCGCHEECPRCKERTVEIEAFLNKLLLSQSKLHANDMLLKELESKKTDDTAQLLYYKKKVHVPNVEQRVMEHVQVEQDSAPSTPRPQDQGFEQIKLPSPPDSLEIQPLEDLKQGYSQELGLEFRHPLAVYSPGAVDKLDRESSDDDDDEYPFGRCYTGSPLLPSISSDSSSSRRSEETGEDMSLPETLNYLGSLPNMEPSCASQQTDEGKTGNLNDLRQVSIHVIM